MENSHILGRAVEKDPWLQNSKTVGFLVLSLNGTLKRKYFKGLDTRGMKQEWNDILGVGPAATGADDVGFITALVDWAVRERKVDPKRVCGTGLFSGGLMVFRLILERPGVFAAAAVFGSNLPERDLPLPATPTPIVLMSGTKDVRMPFTGRTSTDGTTAASRGYVRSAEASRDYFVTANHTNASRVVNHTMPDLDPNDECRIVSQFYPIENTVVAAPVQYYKLDGGGHVPTG